SVRRSSSSGFCFPRPLSREFTTCSGSVSPASASPRSSASTWSGRSSEPRGSYEVGSALDVTSLCKVLGGRMAENGYAKPVLVTTDWLAEHLSDDSVVVGEVDENPDLYDEGHITGAVKLHWRDDLQDPVERDVVDKPTFERLMSERGISNDSTLVLY